MNTRRKWEKHFHVKLIRGDGGGVGVGFAASVEVKVLSVSPVVDEFNSR